MRENNGKFSNPFILFIMAQNCPTLFSISNANMCFENFAGLGTVGYFFLKDDIDKSNFVAEKNVYSFSESTLVEGKKLFRVELKENSQGITGESQKARQGFKLTANLVINTVDERVADFCRSLNNLDWGLILPDGENKYQLLYSPTYRPTLDAGAIKTETGQAASDDRQTTISVVQENVKYPNLFVTFPEGQTPDDYAEVPSAE